MLDLWRGVWHRLLRNGWDGLEKCEISHGAAMGEWVFGQNKHQGKVFMVRIMSLLLLHKQGDLELHQKSTVMKTALYV